MTESVSALRSRCPGAPGPARPRPSRTRAALELGRRLTAHGLIDERDDVFLLEPGHTLARPCPSRTRRGSPSRTGTGCWRKVCAPSARRLVPVWSLAATAIEETTSAVPDGSEPRAVRLADLPGVRERLPGEPAPGRPAAVRRQPQLLRGQRHHHRIGTGACDLPRARLRSEFAPSGGFTAAEHLRSRPRPRRARRHRRNDQVHPVRGRPVAPQATPWTRRYTADVLSRTTTWHPDFSAIVRSLGLSRPAFPAGSSDRNPE